MTAFANSIDFPIKFNGFPFKAHEFLLHLKGIPSKFFGFPGQIQ